MKIKPIILSGGSGIRLWPLSRESIPKQFFDIFNNNTNLFEQTLNRINNLNFDKPIIISNQNQRFNILRSIKNVNVKYNKILLEDKPKNTAPAFAASTQCCNDDQVLCFLPSDHYIKEDKKFINCLLHASRIAMNNHLVVLGLKCREPNENYGYITYNKNNKLNKSFEVESFIEKPNKETAKKLIQMHALWNSGIVLVKNSYLKNLFKKYAEKTFNQVKVSYKKSYKNMEFIFLDEKAWSNVSPISFDYAILEKKFRKIVVPLNISWSDLGTYDALSSIQNSIGNVEKINSKNCFTFSNDNLLIVNDVENLNIVNTKDFTLVSKKSNADDIRKLVSKVSKKRKKEFLYESDSNRPWGSFSNLGEGNGYKVKKLIVLPGQKISLQKHFKRSEHWVVIQGIANITKGKKQFKLRANQSTFIKKGEVHRIENKTKKDLIMIEVQTGDYLEEDDIKRFKDIYNR